VPLLAGQKINPADVTDALFNYRGADAVAVPMNTAPTPPTSCWAPTAISRDGMWAWLTPTRRTSRPTKRWPAMSGDKFEELVRTGAYNPFVSTDGAAAILAPAVLRSSST
jgi:iron complex outermembrane receptor protein